MSNNSSAPAGGHPQTPEDVSIAKRLELTMAHSNIYMWDYDFKNNRCYNTPRAAEDFGLPLVLEDFPDSLLKAGTIDHEAYKQSHEVIDRLSSGESPVRCSSKMRTTTGETMWLDIEYTLIEAQDEQPTWAIAIAHDVSKQHELELKYNAQLDYRARLAATSIFSMRIDLDDDSVIDSTCSDSWLAKLIPDNPTATEVLRTFGNAAAEGADIEGSSVNFYNPQQIRRTFENGNLSEKCRYHCRYLEKYLEGVYHVAKNPSTEHIECFLVLTDITESYLMNHALSSIVKQSYDYVAVVSLTTMRHFFLLHNDAAFTPSEGSARYENEVMDFADRNREYFETEEDYHAAREGMLPANVLPHLQDVAVYYYNVRFRTPNDEAIVWRISFSYLDSSKTHLLVSRSDVTNAVVEESQQQEKLSEALKAAEAANVAKSEFLSRMSHDIRTPMNAILGMATLAQQELDNPKALELDLHKIDESAHYLLSLINDVLDMSRIESGRLALNDEVINPAKLLHSLADLIYPICAKKGLDFDVSVDGVIHDAYVGDLVKLQQILSNLLTNAAKFTPSGGKISMIMSQVDEKDGIAEMKFIVSDNGIGISDEFQDYMFDPFAQEDSGATATTPGTGLGLSIARHMAQLMGGDISVHSIKGVGSRFSVTVYLTVDEETSRLILLNDNDDLPHMDVLVVDNDHAACLNACKLLEGMGMSATGVESGDEALTVLKERCDQGEHFNLALVDWKMPRMDGIQTARSIRDLVGKDITIALFTAFDWRSIESDARHAGVDLFLQKPLFRSTLVGLLGRVGSMSASQEEESPAILDLNGYRVLLVEDNLMNVEVAKRLLSDRGMEVTVASNGLDAIEAFSSAPDNAFDVILMDVRMPVMDGLTASAHIRRLKKKGAKTIPIIAMTADAFDQDVEATQASGMNAHLTKPVDPDVLYATLHKWITG